MAKEAPMVGTEARIAQDAHVTLSYLLYDEDGTLLGRTDDEAPVCYVHGYGQLVSGLERALEGLAKGQSRSIVVPPELGYGQYEPEGVLEVDRSEFPHADKVAVGDEYVAESPEGDGVTLTILDVREDSLVIDTNHPLAGETVRFDVTVLEVRPATSAELADASGGRREREPSLLALGGKPSRATS